MIVTDLLTKAVKNNNYAEDATGGGLWISTTQYKVICPTGKRWFFLGGVVNRDVSATVVASVHNSAGKYLHYLLDEAAATTIKSYAESAYHTGQWIVLDPGDYVWLVFGVAQGASAYVSCVVLEVKV